MLRLIFFAPYVLSEAITAIIFLQILQPDGLVDATLQGVGLGGARAALARRPHLVFYTLFVVITWKYIGFAIILFLAGLQGIPRELHEAAAIDGATQLDDAALHHAAAARADDPHLGVPVDHRLDPALRPRLDHDRAAGRRARRRRWRRTWSTTGVNSLRIGYATRGGRDPVRDLLRRLAPVPALRPAPRHRRARVTQDGAADASAQLARRRGRRRSRTRRSTRSRSCSRPS